MAVHANKRCVIRVPVTCAVYYSDGSFHASGVMDNLTTQGGCVRGTHAVKVGMELVVLVIPRTERALMIKKAMVRWVGVSSFGMELNAEDCCPVGEVDEEGFETKPGPLSLMTH